MALSGSDEEEGIRNLVSARKSLQSCIRKSKALESSIEKSAPRIEEIIQRLPCLEAAVRPIRAEKEALNAVGGHINRAVSPASAVLKVFDAVHGLEKSLLSDPSTDLHAYLSVLKQLEEALKFLGDNCGLAIQWLEDIVEYIDDNLVADQKFISSLKNSLKNIHGLDRTKHDGGLLEASMEKLISEYTRILTNSSTPLPMPSSPPPSKACIAPPPLPVLLVQKLKLIMTRLESNGKLESCFSVFVEVRKTNMTESLKSLNMNSYLDLSVEDLSDPQRIEGRAAQWGRHLQFAVKHLYDSEYRLCADVFGDVSMRCFSSIVGPSVAEFLGFATRLTESRTDPVKLLNLLDVFGSLNRLRPDFNRLFGPDACAAVRDSTRDLVRRVVDGSSSIFAELVVQVELQGRTSPPADGSVPRVVGFVTDYCNRLLGDAYRASLTRVMAIKQSWSREPARIIESAMLDIIRTVESNLDTWSKAYGDDDAALSCFFLMNNHWHLHRRLRSTRLGDALGAAWVLQHEQYGEYYSACFLRDSWGRLPELLSREGLITCSGGRATARDLVKRRLKAFNDAFDELFSVQLKWVVPDPELRVRVGAQISQAVVPVYRSYMHSYGPLVEQDPSSVKYMKYSVSALENMLASLFHPKPVRHGSFKTRLQIPNGAAA